MATTGIVLGAIGLVIAVVLLVAGAAFLNSDTGKCVQTSKSQSQQQKCLNSN